MARAATEGDRDSASELLRIAVAATELIETVCKRNADVVGHVASVAARDGFPILWSWHSRNNQRRKRMVESLEIGRRLPFRTSGLTFDPEFDEIRRLIGVVAMQKSLLRSRAPNCIRDFRPLAHDSRRDWARAMACTPVLKGPKLREWRESLENGAWLRSARPSKTIRFQPPSGRCKGKRLPR
jgi:hypothetical protein